MMIRAAGKGIGSGITASNSVVSDTSNPQVQVIPPTIENMTNLYRYY
jgi:hypothetical protein